MIWIEIVKDMSADNMTETIALNDKNGKSDHGNEGNKVLGYNKNTSFKV